MLHDLCGGSIQAANNMIPQLQLICGAIATVWQSFRPLVLVRHEMLLVVVAYIVRATHSTAP